MWGLVCTAQLCVPLLAGGGLLSAALGHSWQRWGLLHTPLPALGSRHPCFFPGPLVVHAPSPACSPMSAPGHPQGPSPSWGPRCAPAFFAHPGPGPGHWEPPVTRRRELCFCSNDTHPKTCPLPQLISPSPALPVLSPPPVPSGAPPSLS